jgi:NAD+ diphosphatase
MTVPHTFGGNPLDRAATERRDPDWLDSQLERADTRILALWRLNIPIVEGDTPHLAWRGPDVVAQRDEGTTPVLLGLLDGVAHFAINVSTLDDPAPMLAEGASYADARNAATLLPLEEAGILAQAKAQIDWHARHQFCPICGEPTSMHQGGLMRRCDSCNAEHFPRTDPVVIVVVTDGERCLLGRQKSWPPGMFSALAGFVDHGETIEEAVRREVKEETNIDAINVRYHSSQPWPFPMSLMIGCIAEAGSTAITVDELELDGAQWFTRDEARRSLQAPDSIPELKMPGPMAIAHQLIKAWVNE